MKSSVSHCEGRLVSLLIVVVILVALVTTPGALAMAFRVQPSRLSFEITPGVIAVARVNVYNQKLDESATMIVEYLDINQGDNGAIGFVESVTGQSTVQSCVPWIDIDQIEFTIDPGGVHVLEVRFRVPADAAGDYVGAIGIRSIPKSQEGYISLAVRFGVAVEISVTGRTAVKKIEVGDPDLVYLPGDDQQGAREVVRLPVINGGQLSAQVEGTMTVFDIAGDRVRRVMTLPVDQVKVLPGRSFEIQKDTTRRLPSGIYRIVSELMMDGRRLGTRTREVIFSGDPLVQSLVTDAMITLEPRVLTVRGTPGARRRQFAAIKNDGDETVLIDIRVDPVKHLQSVAMRGVSGTQLLCNDWTTVEPSEFELRPGASRRVALNFDYREGECLRPSSFAKLVVDAKYPDGQQAANLSALLVAHNLKIQPVRELELIRVNIASGNNTEYSLLVEYVNVGEAELNVVWNVAVTDASKGRMFQKVSLPPSNVPILPMETRRVNGVLDIRTLDSGQYLMSIEASFEKEVFGREYTLNVTEHSGKKAASIALRQ